MPCRRTGAHAPRRKSPIFVRNGGSDRSCSFARTLEYLRITRHCVNSHPEHRPIFHHFIMRQRLRLDDSWASAVSRGWSSVARLVVVGAALSASKHSRTQPAPSEAADAYRWAATPVPSYLSYDSRDRCCGVTSSVACTGWSRHPTAMRSNRRFSCGSSSGRWSSLGGTFSPSAARQW